MWNVKYSAFYIVGSQLMEVAVDYEPRPGKQQFYFVLICQTEFWGFEISFIEGKWKLLGNIIWTSDQRILGENEKGCNILQAFLGLFP